MYKCVQLMLCVDTSTKSSLIQQNQAWNVQTMRNNATYCVGLDHNYDPSDTHHRIKRNSIGCVLNLNTMHGYLIG